MSRRYQITVSHDGGLAARFPGDREGSNISYVLHAEITEQDEQWFERILRERIEFTIRTQGLGRMNDGPFPDEMGYG